MMDYRSKVLVDIFGESWESHKDEGLKILDYVETHPQWCIPSIPKDEVFSTMDKACTNVWGNPIEYYLQETRQREFVDIRSMLVALYRKQTGAKWHDVAKVFKRDHTTCYNAMRQFDASIKYNVAFSIEYQRFVEEYRRLINE